MRDVQLKVTVRGFLALAGEEDRNRRSETIGGIRVLGIDQLVDQFCRFERPLTAVEIEAVFRDISRAFRLRAGRIVARLPQWRPRIWSDQPAREQRRSSQATCVSTTLTLASGRKAQALSEG